MARKQDKMPKRNKKNFRPTKKGAGMTKAGVAAYRRKNPGSKLKTAVTEDKPRSKARAARRKSYCARSGGIKSDRCSANYWARRDWNC